jgi:hypothetical protein
MILGTEVPYYPLFWQSNAPFSNFTDSLIFSLFSGNSRLIARMDRPIRPSDDSAVEVADTFHSPEWTHTAHNQLACDDPITQPPTRVQTQAHAIPCDDAAESYGSQ